MRGQDWSAWAAVKTLIEAVLRTESTELATLRDHVLGDQLALDGFKGYGLDFRPWSRQLRQPIFLTTGDAVVARAPFPGFLHKVNNLDTLGLDEREVGATDERLPRALGADRDLGARGDQIRTAARAPRRWCARRSG